MIALAALCGTGVGIGVLLVIGGIRGWAMFDGLGARVRELAGRITLPVGLCVGLGAVTLGVTHWPVASVLAGGSGFMAPGLLAGRSGASRMIERTEAIANWTEMLRDTMAGAAGLQSAIDATASAAPIAIRSEVDNLAGRLKHGPLDQALRAFADDLDHPTADLVVAALLLASSRHAKNLCVMLSALSQVARDDATMRMRVEAGRARTKTSVRVVVGFTLALAMGMILLNRSYLDPYDTPTGQLVLAIIGGCFIAAFAWMNKIAAISMPGRILGSTTRAEQ